MKRDLSLCAERFPEHISSMIFVFVHSESALGGDFRGSSYVSPQFKDPPDGANHLDLHSFCRRSKVIHFRLTHSRVRNVIVPVQRYSIGTQVFHQKVSQDFVQNLLTVKLLEHKKTFSNYGHFFYNKIHLKYLTENI